MVDADLKESSRVIQATFQHQEWLFTRSPEDAKDKKALREQTALPREETVFSDSMWSVTDRLLAMSQPKRFDSSSIEMKVVLPYLSQAIQLLEDEKAHFHIPTMVETLQEEQVEVFIQEAKQIYEQGWDSGTSDQKDLKQLEMKDQSQRELAIAFLNQRCEEHGMSDVVVARGRERLSVLLSTSFLVYQERYRQGLFERIEDLKQAADRDEAKQEEIIHDIQTLQSQVSQVGTQISQMQSEVRVAQAQAQEAEASRAKAEAHCREVEQRHPSGGEERGSRCIIL